MLMQIVRAGLAGLALQTLISLNRHLSRGRAIATASVTSRPHEIHKFSEIGITSAPQLGFSRWLIHKVASLHRR